MLIERPEHLLEKSLIGKRFSLKEKSKDLRLEPGDIVLVRKNCLAGQAQNTE